MTTQSDLNRFLKVHESDFEIALSEIKSGKKRRHWMWYIFPQLSGLGYSETAEFYAIRNVDEAKEFLAHPVLGKNLKEITNELLKHKTKNATEIFGSDDVKLKSCMTLFSSVDSTPNNVFHQVIESFFKGQPDQKTLGKLSKSLE